ncbi:MAG: hypothetical protein ACREP7_17780 [Lysobacter sp.]
MSELWSAQQREWLQAMGHTVLALAGAEPPAAPAQALDDGARGRAPTEEARSPSQRTTPMRETEGRGGATESMQARSVPERGDGRDGEHPLLRNLVRAARREAGDTAVLALFDLPSLRGNPAAKRALWPRLRALRRERTRG